MKRVRKVFFDTWGWLAIAHRDDQRHAEAIAFYRNFLVSGGIPVTTDYILSETISLLRARTSSQGTERFIDGILAAHTTGRIIVEKISDDRWAAAWKLCKKLSDKTDISFVDITSFVLMKELKIHEALTADKHYEFVGMGFKRLF